MLERRTMRQAVAIAGGALALLALAACAPPPPAPAAPATTPAAAPVARAAPADAPPPGAYGEREPTADGIGRTYFGREIAHFMSHAGIPWLERDSRESEERTRALLDALDLRPGMSVADIGAGHRADHRAAPDRPPDVAADRRSHGSSGRRRSQPFGSRQPCRITPPRASLCRSFR